MAYFTDEIGVNIKYAPPNPIMREISVTGEARRLVDLREAVKDKVERQRLEAIAQGLMPPAGETLGEILNNDITDGLERTLKTIRQGLINGESYAKQVTRVKDVFNHNVSNTARIIRTEGNRNMNAGAYLNSEELKNEGVPIRRRWVATLDSNTRDRHAQLDGQYEDENGEFHIGGYSARYPGNFNEASLDINCRCSVIDEVQGLPPQIRRAKDPVTGKTDIINFKTYDEWKK